MKILGFLPGYMWCNDQLMSTGAAIPPTQHVSPKNGEILYYCRPFFEYGPSVGMYVRKAGIEKAIAEGLI